MNVRHLLQPYTNVDALPDVTVTDVTLSSRHVAPGSLFIALSGTVTDGHHFIEEAIRAGARVILCERMPEVLHDMCTYVVVPSTHDIVADVVARFFDYPARQLRIVGVTGTNGKTTIATLLYQFFMKRGYRVGLLSTVRVMIHDTELPATHTTPDVVTLHRNFRAMVDAGCEYCFMEVSSHALDQGRVQGIDFVGAIFSNITHDHLDYHKTFEAYFQAKQKLFTGLHPHAWVLMNADDPWGVRMGEHTSAARHYYSLHGSEQENMFSGEIQKQSFAGTEIVFRDQVISTPLVGMFNAYNSMAIISAALLLGETLHDIQKTMPTLQPATGRFDVLRDQKEHTVVIDYAHTPDALENVLKTIRTTMVPEARIVTVFGCGGDRDTTKRPVMGKIAQSLSNHVIITSDNPRTENPQKIIDDICAGITDMSTVEICEDRKQAIVKGFQLLRPGDILLVAGKGHETYQDIQGVKHHFDDKEIVLSLM